MASRHFLRHLARNSALVRLARSGSNPLRAASPKIDFDPSDEAFAPIAEAVFAELAATTAEAGRGFAVVFLPDPVDLRHPESVAFTDWLAGLLAARSIPFVDLTPDFRALSPSEREHRFMPDGHYTPQGYRLVATALARELPAVLDGFPADCGGAEAGH